MVYRVDRNNYHKKEKKSTIYTPMSLSWFIFNIIKDKIDKNKIVLDPCVGSGRLLKPFQENNFSVMGIDIKEQGFLNTRIENYLAIKEGEIDVPSIVIMNPPFNIEGEIKKYIKIYYKGRPLLPELWMQKTIELFGKNIPMVLIAPYGLRLNQTTKSNRWQKFVNGVYPEIASIISLPNNMFDDILFHSEVLIFNISELKSHYFYFD